MSGAPIKVPPTRPGSVRQEALRSHPLKMMPSEYAQESQRFSYPSDEYSLTHNQRHNRNIANSRPTNNRQRQDSRAGSLEHFIDPGMWSDPWIGLYAGLSDTIRNNIIGHLSEQELQRLDDFGSDRLHVKRRMT